MADTFNPNSQETEATGSLWVQGQCGLHSELQDSQSFVETPCLKKHHPYPYQKKKPKKLQLKPHATKQETKHVCSTIYIYSLVPVLIFLHHFTI